MGGREGGEKKGWRERKGGEGRGGRGGRGGTEGRWKVNIAPFGSLGERNGKRTAMDCFMVH